MKRLLNNIFLLIFIVCCSFLICCGHSETSNQSSCVQNSTSNEDSSAVNETCKHDFIWNVIKEPTCSTYGEKKGVCSRCLEIKYQAIALIQHDFSDGLFCKLCDAIATDFYVPDNFTGGLTIKEIENKLALFNLSFDDLTQIELSSIYINYKGIFTLSVKTQDISTSITVSDLHCNYAIETHSTSKISTLKVTRSSQLNVYAIDAENEESYIGSLDGTERIQRLFVNQNNDLFAVYDDNAAIKIGTLYVNQVDESSGLIYRQLADKEYAVIGFIETGEEHIKIPDTFNGLPVTLIANHAFEGNERIKSVQIGNHINTIGNWAFWKCTSLQTIYLPDSPLEIRNGAFYRTNLTTVYYQGNEDTRKNKLIIPTAFNEPLLECTWIYNSTFKD